MAKRYLTQADVAQMQAAAAPSSSSPSGERGTGRQRDTVHSITSTPEALSVDMGRRMKVYGVQMFLRVACFFGFVLVDNLWWRVACVVGLVLLPWTAVLLANAGADKSERTSNYVSPDFQPELSARPHDHDDAAPSAESSPGGGASGAHSQEVPDDTVVEGQWS
ncbi:DUF3099 domain-containing protein [Kocuria sp.]|uniref:DUF3099 domain-containing protein n=1 Tax=Kocuria sp. TaxID=1871328 RepID=UPI0026DF2C33|nr:DUF3099 domain-containing protein [Kocuria sp.]MDO5617780.1 DUF3099 domain-containing protein [Kocuria sp.]